MATLTIEGQQSGIVPAYSQIEYKARVSPTSAADTVSIYLFNESGEKITEWNQRADYGLTDTFTFRAEEIIQSLLGYNLQPTSAFGVVSAPQSIVDVLVAFNDPSNNNSIIGQEASFINACIQPDEMPGLALYVMDGTIAKKFLTHSPQLKEVQLGEHEMLSLVTTVTSGVDVLLRKYLKGSSTPVETVKNVPAITLASKRLDLGVGPQNLNRYVTGLLNNDVDRYDVTLVSSGTQNLFVDMDNGTAEANINGFLAGPNFTSGQHSTTHARTGSHSLMVDLANGPIDGSFNTGFTAATPLSLVSGKTYTMRCYAYVTGTIAPGATPAMRIAIQGLNDAAVTYDTSWQAGPLNSWYQLTTTLTVGNDTTGNFILQKAGNWDNLVVYFDDFAVSGLKAYSETRRFKLQNLGTDTTRVHFLNRLGGFDSYTFSGAEKRTVRASGSTFQKLRPAWGFNPSARGRQVFQKEANVRLSCSSDALRPDEMAWLEELITSPAVYVQQGDNHIPVVLKEGEFEILDPVKNIHRLRVELEYANDLVMQQG